MDSLPGALRFAFRSLRRSPAFAAVVIITIAVAIGATATMMSVVNAALVRALPFPDARQLVIAQGWVGREQAPRGVSYPEAMDWRERSRLFDGLAAYDQISLNLADAAAEPVRADAEIVTDDFFRVLGANAARGRIFGAEEHRTPDALPVAVISHSLWQTRFGSSDAIVGRDVTINARPFTIIGVMPEGFRGVSFDADLWIPMMMVSVVRPVSILDSRPNRWLGIVGRMKPGVTIDDARRDLDRVALTLATEYPETNTDRGANVQPLRDYYLGDTKRLLLALFGAVGFLLLIACANVMSLQLVRAATRRREMALRMALGAGRHRLVRQLLVEALVLASVGAACGVLLALWGVDILSALAPAGLLPPFAQPSIDGWVLGAIAVIALIAGAAFGLVPAWASSRSELVPHLKDGAPSASAGLGTMRRLRGQQLFVIGEVALALVLLSGATLMIRSFQRQLLVDPGFRAEGVLAGRVMLPRGTYPPQARVRFAEQVVDRLQATPGVEAATISSDLPLRGIESGGYLRVENGPEDVPYMRHRVSPEYFETLGVQLRDGRVFTRTDGPDAPRVAIVSALMARRLWPEGSAVGKRISLAGTSGALPWVEVVGVVDNVRHSDLTSDMTAAQARVDIYFPFAQSTDETVEIAVRGASSPEALTGELRRAVAAIDPALPLFDVAAMTTAVQQQTMSARFGSLMLGLFAGLAIILAGVGIYGLLAFMVGTSRREIAIRMALGAASSSVVALVVKKGMSLVIAGGLLGAVLAVPSMQVLTNLLYTVKTNDPVMMASVALVLFVASLLACWLPAVRASRIAPQAALKSD
ncbi:MAG TPA: ABC transporter permease [Gemmatimonadaceae bacterium]|nr:ABC transporter permease [Gemmatimonadaceae bacterium]